MYPLSKTPASANLLGWQAQTTRQETNNLQDSLESHLRMMNHPQTIALRNTRNLPCRRRSPPHSRSHHRCTSHLRHSSKSTTTRHHFGWQTMPTYCSLYICARCRILILKFICQIPRAIPFQRIRLWIFWTTGGSRYDLRCAIEGTSSKFVVLAGAKVWIFKFTVIGLAVIDHWSGQFFNLLADLFL